MVCVCGRFIYLEGYLSGEGVSVIDDRHAVIPVPAVQLHAPAALQKDLHHHGNPRGEHHIVFNRERGVLSRTAISL